MTLFTSLGPSADCRGLTQVPTYRERTGHARGAAFSVSQRRFSLGWGLQGKVARTPHQSKGSDGTVCPSMPLPRGASPGARWEPPAGHGKSPPEEASPVRRAFLVEVVFQKWR